MSHASACSRPPASAQPLIAPTIGLRDVVQAAREAAEAEVDDLADPRIAALDDRRDVGLQVGAGAERVARAGDDRDVGVRVVAEVRPDLDELVLHLGVDRVLGLGAVERDVARSGRASRTGPWASGLRTLSRSGAAAVGARRSANSSTGSLLPFSGIGGRGIQAAVVRAQQRARRGGEEDHVARLASGLLHARRGVHDVADHRELDAARRRRRSRP